METLKGHYGASGNSIYETVRTVEGYKTIKAPPSLQSRLLLEDVPMGLVPMAELAKLVGVKTPIMNMIIDLHQLFLIKILELREEVRKTRYLGMDLQELKEYIRYE